MPSKADERFTWESGDLKLLADWRPFEPPQRTDLAFDDFDPAEHWRDIRGKFRSMPDKLNKVGAFVSTIDAHAWAREHLSGKPHSQVDDYASPLFDYQATAYHGLNGWLRGLRSGYGGSFEVIAREHGIKGMTNFVKKIDQEVEVQTTDEPVSAWRGTFVRGLLADPESMVGEDYVDKGFVSTSLAQNIADIFLRKAGTRGTRILMRVYLPKGTKGRYMSLDPNTPSEAEFLIPRGMTYRVVHVAQHKDANGPYYYMEAILRTDIPQDKSLPTTAELSTRTWLERLLKGQVRDPLTGRYGATGVGRAKAWARKIKGAATFVDKGVADGWASDEDHISGNALETRTMSTQKWLMPIYQYIASSYHELNGFLRGTPEEDRRDRGNGSFFTTEQLREMAFGMDKALDQELVEPVVVHRGTFTRGYLRDPESLIGKTYVDKGFVSTAFAEKEARHFSGFMDENRVPIVQHILLPKGTQGRYIRSGGPKAAYFAAGESEFILPRGYTYRVIDVQAVSPPEAHYEMYMEVVPEIPRDESLPTEGGSEKLLLSEPDRR